MQSHKTSVEKSLDFFPAWFRTIRPGEPGFRPSGIMQTKFFHFFVFGLVFWPGYNVELAE